MNVKSLHDRRNTVHRPAKVTSAVNLTFQMRIETCLNHVKHVYYMFSCVFGGPGGLLRVPYIISEITLKHHIFMPQLMQVAC